MANGPIFSIVGVDVGSDDLLAQLPVEARLVRTIPGPDRPDYSLAVASAPVRHRTTLETLASQGIDPASADPQLIRIHDDGTVDLQIFGLVVAARIAGERLHAGMTDFPVMLAYVIDNTLMSDETLDFSKVLYSAVAFVTDTTQPAVA